MTTPGWQKSSYCGSAACVEVLKTDSGVLLRDSKDPGIAPLRFSTASWTAFLDGIAAGEFDRP